MVRVRFAPSPTGYLHIGGARTALYNYLFAKKNSGKFILRIEDTDRERSTKESVGVILDALRWMGVEWDEGPEKDGGYGPYFQSERPGIYREYIKKALETGSAYKCYCTKEELDAEREKAKKEKRPYIYSGKCRNAPEQDRPHTVRLRVDKEGEIVINDIIRGEVRFKNSVIDDFIIARQNGSPVYNFVVAVDDALMKISHVIRGEDHLSNTPKQVKVYEALGFEVPEFAHIPLILGPDRARLSKRHGATSVTEYEKMGILPQAFINAVALLGWSYDDKTEKFTLDELREKFDLSRVNSSAAMFDNTKMGYFNGIYIRKMSVGELADKCAPFFKKAGYDISDREYLEKVVALQQEKIRSFTEAAEISGYFFRDYGEMDKKAKKVWEKNSEHRQKVLSALERIINSDGVSAEKVEERLRGEMEKEGIKPKVFMHVIRVALTGTTAGPGLFDVIETLGKETCLKRIKKHL